jgi:hypothetical protein
MTALKNEGSVRLYSSRQENGKKESNRLKEFRKKLQDDLPSG